LEHDHSSFWLWQFVYLDKCNPVGSSICNFAFQTIQILSDWPKSTSYDLMMLVFDTKDQPGMRLTFQVCFVAKG
jgi:hypothetical protein